ncbi:MAG: hypothetical protein ACLQGV_06795 [Bryobacteraceae bacterium]
MDGALPPLSAEKAEEIRAALERVLSSHQFRGSRRCQNLLRHLTEQTLAGATGGLKERTLGVEVFGRPPDYDTSQEPVVRATAAEIRKKLAQYYQEPGHESEARIDLQSGSYVAEFHFNGGADAATKRPRRRLVLASAVGGVALLALLAAGLVIGRPARSVLDQLWAPLLQTPGATLVCVGQPIVYNLKSTEAQDAIQGILALQNQAAPATGGAVPSRDLLVRTPAQDRAQDPRPASDAIPRKDLLILSDRYVDLGDAICLARVASLIDRSGRPYRIRGDQSTSFTDLSEGASVLIGAFNNQWTLRALSRLRYSFVKDSVHEIDMIRDRQHPERADWTLKGAWPYWDVSNDYAIVARIVDATTNRPVIIAAGITRHGTTAAGEFLTNPEYFAEAAARFGAGWQKKNVEVVLGVPVVNRVPGRPRILAYDVR